MPTYARHVLCIPRARRQDLTVWTALVRAPTVSTLPMVARAHLSASEQREFHSVPQRRRRDWLSGRIALKTAYLAHANLARGAAFRGITVTRTASGAPGIGGDPRAHCSIAHAAGWGLAAVSESPVGIDLEPEGRMAARLAPAFSDSAEWDLLLASGLAREWVPTVIWTMKEAVLKARGTGLQTHPRRVRLVGRSPCGWTAHAPHGNSDGKLWNVVTLRCGPLRVAVARAAVGAVA